MVVRQDFVPWISFHAEFEVAVPNSARKAFSYERRRHVIVEFVVIDECGHQCGEDLVRPLNNCRDRIDESFVITRLVPFDRWKDRRYDIRRAALLREKNLNARACGLRCLDKDESILVRNDHGAVLFSTLSHGQ